MSQTLASSLKQLQLAIHGVTSPFCCAGTLVPDKPVTLVFKDRTRCAVTRTNDPFGQRDALRPLRDHCKPAPFGDGKKTRYDRSVRDALQLTAEKGGFRVENFDPEAAGILAQIQHELLPHDPNPITAELYTVNVYTDGGHFAPHKDTPRGSDMFGSLVVCLPSRFQNGQLILQHRGVVQRFDWGRAIEAQDEPNQLHWAALFGDVDHQIDRIWYGTRVTLTYLLRRGAGGALPCNTAAENLEPHIAEAWHALLADRRFLAMGGTLGYPCCHLYHQDARFQETQRAITRQSATMLKGRDQQVAATALQAGLKVAFVPYMFETCGDATWQLARFPTRDEKKRLGRQMADDDLERILPIRARSEDDDEDEDDFGVTWLEEPPASGETPRHAETEDDTGPPAAARLHSCDYCPWGYFGNESSEVDFYTFAALHIAIPAFGKGVRAAKKPSKRTPAKRATSTRRRKGNAD